MLLRVLTTCYYLYKTKNAQWAFTFSIRCQAMFDLDIFLC
jgi:hypothetical protein